MVFCFIGVFSRQNSGIDGKGVLPRCELKEAFLVLMSSPHTESLEGEVIVNEFHTEIEMLGDIQPLMPRVKDESEKNKGRIYGYLL